MIDGYSNNRIGKKAPSEYTSTFANDNTDKAVFPATLQTHLIKDIEVYGVNTNDYDLFIARRAKAIALALNVKLMSLTLAQAAEAEKAV